MDIFVPKATAIPIRGFCRGHQTELDFVKGKDGILVPKDTGFVIKDTMWDGENTITDKLRAYLAYKIGADVTDYAMDSLFAAEGLVAGNDEKGGIIEAVSTGSTGSISPGDVDTCFITTLNDGGDNTEVYIEFYGYKTGSYTIDDYLILGQGYENTDDSMDHVFAYISASQSIAANRRYHHYWKITLS